jgi:hypothetical protein
MFSQNCGASLAQPHNSSSESNIPLLTTCPGCGRKNVRVRIIRIRKKKSRPAIRVVKKSFGDNDYEEEIHVKKKLNPSKACNLFTISDAGPIKNPVLSLPRLEREDIGANIRLAIDIQRKYIRSQYLPSDIALSVFDKYPSVREKIAPIFPLIMKGYEVLEEVRESAANDQMERSLIDWISICNTAINEGYHAASSKYYAITPDGKKKYLSPKHMKNKIPQIQDFTLRYKKYVRFYVFFARYMLKIAENDPKLSQELKEIELKHMREFIPDLLQMFRSKLIEVQGDTMGTFNNQSLNRDKEDYNNNGYYEYVESRYFDEKMYEEQKMKVKQDKRKSNPDGWKTCCILKPNELPVKTLEELQRLGQLLDSHIC